MKHRQKKKNTCAPLFWISLNSWKSHAHISIFSIATLTPIFSLSAGNKTLRWISSSPVTMTGTTCHLQEGIVLPCMWRWYFFASLRVQLVKQTAFAAVVTVPLFGFDDARLAQIPQGASDGRRGQLQITGNRADGRPALALPVDSVREIDIDCHRTMRQFFLIDIMLLHLVHRPFRQPIPSVPVWDSFRLTLWSFLPYQPSRT